MLRGAAEGPHALEHEGERRDRHGDDGCELTLVYELSPEWADYEDRTRQGWTDILDTLGTYLQTAT